MALSTQKQVEALAEQLTACADAIHSRLMNAIKKKEIDRVQAQAMFQDEALLRQRANGLYIDAAKCLVEGLARSQASLLGTIDLAAREIRSMKNIASTIDLVADILVLAAAAYAAKPGPILAALKEIRDDIQALDT
jgi:hypothetical protein